jgi:hypothetical protein
MSIESVQTELDVLESGMQVAGHDKDFVSYENLRAQRDAKRAELISLATAREPLEGGNND